MVCAIEEIGDIERAGEIIEQITEKAKADGNLSEETYLITSGCYQLRFQNLLYTQV